MNRNLFLMILAIVGINMGYSQTNPRLKPYSSHAQEDEINQFVITTEGKLIKAPQYVYLGDQMFCDEIIKNKKGKNSAIIYHLNPNFINLVTPGGVDVDKCHFMPAELKRIKANLEGLEKVDEGSELGKRIESLLKDMGLTFKDFRIAAKNISNGQEPDTNYQRFFPLRLEKYFKEKNKYQPFSIILHPPKDGHTNYCDCRPTDNQTFNILPCEVCEKSDQIKSDEKQPGLWRFEVVRNDTLDDLMANWIKSFRVTFIDSLKSKIETYNTELENVKEKEWDLPKINKRKVKVSALTVHDTLVDTYDKDADKSNMEITLKSLYDELDQKRQRKQEILGELESQIGLYWFWYTGSIDGDPLKNDFKNKIDSLEEKLAQTKNKLLAYDKIIGGGIGGDFERTDLEKLITNYDSLLNQQSELEKGLAKAKRIWTSYTTANQSFFTKKTTVYSGMFYASDSSEGSTYFMRNHNAEKSFQLMGEHREAYYAYEKVKYLCHNIKPGQEKLIELKLDATSKANANPEWVSDIGAIFDELSPLADLSQPSAANEWINNLLKQKDNKSNSVGGRAVKSNFDDDLSIKEKIKLIQKLVVELDTIDLGKWLDAKLKSETKDNRVLNSTQEIEPLSPTYQKPVAMTYSFNRLKEDKTLDKSFSFTNSFSHYKFKKIQVFGGFNYSPAGIQTISISDTTGTAIPSTSTNYVYFNAGVKLYPCGGDVLDKRFFMYNNHRFFISLSTSIPKPLDNWYIGIGNDFVPGLSYHLGLHLYRDFNYDIANGAITGTTTIYRPAFYFGLGADVSVVTKAIKYFF